ncbi:MAG TPA: hypothetical protein PLU14_00290 [Caldisericia bacterium]|nr:hypothetical protein [Caldisericia bacterium]
MFTELMDIIACKNAITPVASTTTATITGNEIDRLGYETGVAYILTSAADNVGTATYTVYECDTSGGSFSATSTTGTISLVTTTATATEVRLDLRGLKRYIKLVVNPPGATVTVAGAVVLGGAPSYPV